MSDIQHLTKAANWWRSRIASSFYQEAKVETAILAALENEWNARLVSSANWEEDIKPIILTVFPDICEEGCRGTSLGFFLENALKKYLSKHSVKRCEDAIQMEVGFLRVRAWINGTELTIWEREEQTK